MKEKMIRLFIAALVLIMIIALSACSVPDQPTEKSETDTSNIQVTTEDPTMEIDGFSEKGNEGEGDSAVDNTSGLSGFYYSYQGSIGANNYSYEIITEDDGTITFECKFMEYEEYGTMSCEIDEEILDELYDIYLKHRIARWNGYDKYAEGILDGDGFNLTMEFKDGEFLSASGSNCYPDGYYEFLGSMEAVLRPVAEGMTEEKRQEIIGQGFSGDLDAFMVTFKQQGSSGSDKYDFFIMHSADRENNFDVQIESDSGEFFEKGSYVYYCALDDDAIDFDGIKALFEKYELINWYNYDETADDYADSEWFQIVLSFEDGTLKAMGTEHPDNYDEFRNDFLNLMSEMIKNAETNCGLKQYNY